MNILDSVLISIKCASNNYLFYKYIKLYKEYNYIYTGKNKDVLDFENLSKPEEADGEKDATKKAAKAAPKKAVAKPAPKAQSKAKGGVKKAGNLKAG